MLEQLLRQMLLLPLEILALLYFLYVFANFAYVLYTYKQNRMCKLIFEKS